MNAPKEYRQTNADKQLPELNQALLDWNTVEDLFDDLNACTRIIGVQAKQAASSFSEAEALSLEEAMTLLKSGQVRSVQVWYDYQNQNWCDTLICRGDQVQLIRIADKHR